MKKTIKILIVTLFAVVTVNAQENTIKLENSSKEITINRNIYGHFAEHLGRLIYGGLYVGEENTEIPNTNGVRNDIIEALKNLNIPNLRWPGGCFADTYHWKDGVGPKEDRPSIVNTMWGGVTEDNSFGTHDFLNLCEVLGAEPYLAGNVGSGEVQELADWVQYVNFEGESPMSDWRKENGREEPWGVKFWGVGNEAWGCGGHMTAEYYANIYRKYATFMAGAGVEGGLFRIASGATDDKYEWTEVLMRDIPHHLLQGVALHHYATLGWSVNKGSSIEFSDDQYFTIMERSWEMEEFITKHAEIMDKYDPKNRVALIVDEWGGWYEVMPDTDPGFLYQQNTMRDAMIAGMNLNIFNNHARRVKMANLAQTVNVLQAVILTEDDKMLLTPTYHVMEMYKVHQDATLILLKIETANYEHNGKSLPALNASASKKDGKTSISIVNIDLHKSQKVSIALGEDYKKISGKILKSENVRDHNSFDNPEKIQPQNFNGAKLKKNEITVTLPPFSVIMLSLE